MWKSLLKQIIQDKTKMVNISGISRRLKVARTEDFLKQEFKGFDITTSSLGIVSVKKEDIKKEILLIGISDNKFTLFDRKYFHKSYAVAEKYEQELLGDGAEVDFRLRYYVSFTLNT